MGSFKSPTGTRIVGTAEILYGVSNLQNVVRGEDGGYALEHTGYTKIDYDSQCTETNEDGHTEYIDEDGGRWSEDELIYVDEPCLESDDCEPLDSEDSDEFDDLCDKCMRSGVQISRTDEDGNTICTECDTDGDTET